MAKRENFYRRDPMAALNGMIGLSLEEKGVYNTIIDLLYSTWRPVEDSRPFIANWCGCAVQKLNPILDRLIAKGKIRRVQEGEIWVLTNDRFDDERASVKGSGTGRRKARPQGEVEEKSPGVGEKSGGVDEKSPGVSDNMPLLGGETQEKQPLTPLEKTREEESRENNAFSNDVETRPKRGARLKPDWRPSVENIAYAVTEGFTEAEAERIAANFRDYWIAASGSTAAKLDWSATWRQWVRRERDRRRPAFGGSGQAKRVGFV